VNRVFLALASLGYSCTTGSGSGRDASTDAAVCVPRELLCDGDRIVRCSTDGSALELVEVCDPSAGAVCSRGLASCASPCANAEASDSYVGCTYWPVTLLNNQISADPPSGLAVANVSEHEAHVALTLGDRGVHETTIPPGEVAYVELPAVEALAQHDRQVVFSALVRGGAYRLRSTMPVTVYQFNPFEGVKEGGDPTFSADASLLLPEHVMGEEYLVLGWRSEVVFRGTFIALPALVAIVAVEDATVRVTPSERVGASLDGIVRAAAAGEELTFELAAGDVIQLLGDVPIECEIVSTYRDWGFCDLERRGDLSGTRIRSTAPVQVFSGASCALVPFDRPACDHLEETLPPLAAWGRESVVGVLYHHESQEMVVRIISSAAENELVFTPAVHEPVVLGEGEVLEFTTQSAFRVVADDPILVAQFLTGQGSTMDARLSSDPSLAFAPPVEQFRTQYRFAVPPTYAASFATVIAPAEVTASLDGEPLRSFTAIGDSGYVAARIEVSEGPHDLVTSVPSSLMVYGYNPTTSYLYPGGLDVRSLLE
jgi:hypothetical protein